MKRRTLLKALAGGTLLSAPLLGRSNTPKAMGKRGSLKKLVVVFQRGGNDGLNTLIPVNPSEYNLYQNLRPDVHIPNADILSIPGNSFFGLHPALSELIPIYQAGSLGLIHAVGYPNPDRSHFESQAYMETAVPGNSLMGGWLNRYLSETSGPGLIRGLSVGYNIPQSVTGSLAVPVSANFGTSDISVDYTLNSSEELAYEQKIRDLFAMAPSPGNMEVYGTGGKIFQMIDSFSDRNLNNYVPENGANYPSSSFGSRVKHAAQMLKDDSSFLGVEVITIDQGGFDTHANQLNPANPTATDGTHYGLLRDLSRSMRAFFGDMGTRMNDVIFLVVSEFGRRAYQNLSNGTDHGTGGVALVMGHSVNGQVFNGGSNWPGLDNLYQGDLNWATDFRDIYWEILSRHIGVDNATLNTIIPGHTYSPVGFLS